MLTETPGPKITGTHDIHTTIYHQGGENPQTHVIRRMPNADAVACNACPIGHCHFSPGRDGQGVCLVVYAGILSPSSVARIGTG